MAYEGHGNVVAMIEVRLEGQQREHGIHGVGDLLHPPLPPRPYRGAHVVGRRDASGTQLLLQPNVEVRGIDTDHDVRLPSQRLFTQGTAHTDEFWQVLEHLDQPHHREGFERKAALQALGLHTGAAHTAKLHLGMPGAQRLHQPSTKDIAGEFACHKVYALQCHSDGRAG